MISQKTYNTKSEINKHKNLLVSIDNIFTIENI